jgi:hypothetical protein
MGEMLSGALVDGELVDGALADSELGMTWKEAMLRVLLRGFHPTIDHRTIDHRPSTTIHHRPSTTHNVLFAR